MKFRHPNENTLAPMATLMVQIDNYFVPIDAIRLIEDLKENGRGKTIVYVEGGLNFDTDEDADTLRKRIGWFDIEEK